ncbi:MAG TPA: hypothetical protein VMG30_12015 [Acidobacteriota bacterium]|nr:hypothetical protein [Acidobacteriota bacterium]
MSNFFFIPRLLLSVMNPFILPRVRHRSESVSESFLSHPGQKQITGRSAIPIPAPMFYDSATDQGGTRWSKKLNKNGL